MLEQRPTSCSNGGAVAPGVEPEHLGVPRARIDEPEQHANRSSLAGPVRSEKPEHDALRDLERECIERAHRSEVDSDVLGANRELAAVRHRRLQPWASRSTARTGAASSAMYLSGRAISSYPPGATRRRSRFSRMYAFDEKSMWCTGSVLLVRGSTDGASTPRSRSPRPTSVRAHASLKHGHS